MASVNKVIIIGNLGRDPEIRYTPSGSAICSINVATSRSWKDKTSNERVEETEWHRITFFDRLAEIAGEYLKKGSSVYVEGRLKTRKYTDKDGIERYATDIIAEEMKMLGGRGDGMGEGAGGGGGGNARSSYNRGGNNSNDGDSHEPPQRAERPARAPAGRPAPAPVAQKSSTGFDDMDDDIPF
jgi:single-strand DNA-binding protein